MSERTGHAAGRGGRARRERASVATADLAGEGLTVTIRVGRDGRVYFQDIPPGLVPVALALVPQDQDLRARAKMAAEFERVRASIATEVRDE